MELKFDKERYNQLVLESNEKEIILKNLIPLLVGESGSCLDVGAGNFYFARKLKDGFERYVALDREIYEKVPAGVELIEGDWEEVELNEKFDVILAIHVVGYFKDLNKGIKKLIESLKPKGKLFIVQLDTGGDYGSYLEFYKSLADKRWEPTFVRLKAVLSGRKYKEYRFPVSYYFDSYEELYNMLKLIFNRFPEDYLKNKTALISYLQENIKGEVFIVEQKIIEVMR